MRGQVPLPRLTFPGLPPLHLALAYYIYTVADMQQVAIRAGKA